MKMGIANKWKISIALVLAFMVGGVLSFPTSRFVLHGWLYNESFYRGRPTSYWSYELQHWRNITWDGCDFYGHSIRCWVRSRAGWEEWIEKWLSYKFPTHYQDELPLLMGEPAALPVLTELLKDQHILIQRIAVTSLERMGTAARPAMDALLQLAREKLPPNTENKPRLKWLLRFETMQAIRSIDPEAGSEFKAELEAPSSRLEYSFHRPP